MLHSSCYVTFFGRLFYRYNIDCTVDLLSMLDCDSDRLTNKSAIV